MDDIDPSAWLVAPGHEAAYNPVSKLCLLGFEVGRIVGWANAYGTEVPRPLASHFIVITPHDARCICPKSIFTDRAH